MAGMAGMAGNESTDNFSLLKLAPVVLRARDFRLYTQCGRRLVDLWLNGGTAVLGHTPASMLRELKNTASRGLYAPFPNFLEDRFIKALSCLFPGRSFRLYSAPPPELKMFLANGTASLWRPFADIKSPLAVADNAPPILVPVMPGIQGWRNGMPLGLCVLAFNPDFSDINMLPQSDILPPVLLAVAKRGIYDLIAVKDKERRLYPKIAKALAKKGWRRTGIYIYPREKPAPEAWAALFRQFLDAGFLLPPVSSQPLILPGVLSAGEEAKLAAVFNAAVI